MVASAALQEWFGENGIILAAALAGFVDTHSAAISVASLVASGKLTAADAVLPILTGTFDQHDQQAGPCRHERWPLVCHPRNPRIDTGRAGGVGGRAFALIGA